MEMLTATSPSLKSQLIDEQVHHAVLTLVEGDGTRAGRVFARGEFGHTTKPTANNRRYPKKIWEKNIDRLQENLQGRKVLGELDHPSDGRTSLQRASHVITEIRLEDDRVMGEAEILDTSKGRDLKAILAAGVPVGISSRGYGSTQPDGEGIEEVQDDYKLVTFDFVAEPADSTAYPQVFFEGTEIPVERRMTDEETVRGTTEVISATPPVVEDVVPPTADHVDDLRKEFSEQVLSRIEAMRTEITEQVRQELMKDPTVAGAADALRQIQGIIQPFALSEDVRTVLATKDQEIETLRKQLQEAEIEIEQRDELIEKLTAAAREAGYKYHLECLLSGHPEEVASIVRDLVPDVNSFESADSLTEHVETALRDLGAQRSQEQRNEERRQSRLETLRGKNRELTESLSKAKRESRDHALRAYAAQRLQSHPKGAKIMRMLETTGFQSEKQIDEMIDHNREPRLDADDLEVVRDRVRQRLGSGIEHLGEDRALTSRTERGINGLGMSLPEYRKLSGLNEA
jgi:hypothetical protein